MPKILEDLDGKRKYLRTDDQGNKYYVRVITSSEELKKCAGNPKANWEEMENEPDLRYLLGPIERRSVEKVKKQNPGKTVISTVPERTNEEKYNATTKAFQAMMDNFDQDDNAAIVAVENEAGQPVSAMKIYIDNQQKRIDMKVDPTIGTFVFLDYVGTANHYEGQSFFADGFDEVLTMINDPERKLPQPLQFSVSMVGVTIKDQDKETKYVMNSDLYASMWQKYFLNTELQNRWKLPAEIGLGKMPLAQFLREDGSLNQEKIDSLIKDQEVHAQRNGAAVRGLYFNGISRSYEENKYMIERFRQKRSAKTESVYDKSQNKGWEEVPNSTVQYSSASAVRVTGEDRTK